MTKLYLGVFLSFLATLMMAQVPLLDPITHPKFQNAIPSPTKINVGANTTTMKMAQTTQWLGLVSPTNTSLQTNVWGYGLSTGAVSFPGPTLVANSNSVANIEWTNTLPQTHLLPVDSTYHRAMAINGVPTVVHLHGSHVEAASDGNPEAWYTNNYGQKGPAWTKNVYSYDNTQESATLWYHDHTLGMTRLNVYAGLAGFYLLNDANDQAVSLPRGNYDRELVVQDRMFDNTGQLYLPSDPAVTNGGLPEFFGDFILVNGMVWPYMNVEPRKYRFRLLNGSDSRVYVFNLSNNASFLQIATDNGKLNNPVALTTLTLMPGERSEIIVDFSTMNGQQITLLNNGTDEPFGNPASVQADPATTGQIMQFRVNQPLNSAVPDVVMTTATNLRPTLGAIQDVGTPIKTRKLGLFEGTDDLGRILPMLGIVDPTNPNDGSLTWHDPVTENVNTNDTEIWEIYNTTADAHPVHLHLVSFQILSKQTFTGTLTDKMQMLHNGGMGMGSTLSNIALTGTPTNFTPAQSGWKDTHILMPGEVMRIKAKFDRTGEYVWHCHILSHEDHDMMRKLVVGNPCATDVTPPVMTACPANKNLTTTGTTAVASWTAPTATDNCATPSVTYTTSPTVGLTNGGNFPVGTTTVSYMAMDANNNMSMCSFNVVVTIQAKPSPPTVFSASRCDIGSLTLTATGCTGGTVNWYENRVGGGGSWLAAGPSFTTPLLTQTTTYYVYCLVNGVWSDPVLATASIEPVPLMLVNCPTNIAKTTTTTCAATTWVAPTSTDNCSSPTVSFTTTPTVGLTNGACFPIGTTTVTYKATDSRNNISTCSFVVSVSTPCLTDVTAPVMTACPANKNLTTTGTTAVASWTAPTATDNCATPSVTYTTSPTVGLTNGGNFPVGTTTVSYMAMDANNNMSMCNFNVVVTIQAKPSPPTVFSASRCDIGSLTLTATGCTGGTVNWYENRVGGGGSWLAAGSSFTTPLLTQTTTYYVYCLVNGVWSDPVLATASIEPVPLTLVNCPTNIAKTTTTTCAATTWVAPTSTDNCSSPTVSFTTSPTVGLTNGACFPIGTTTVTYKATDSRNNISTCSFVVNVTNACLTDATAPVMTACPANQNLSTTGTTAVASWTAPTATDNCTTPSVTYTTSPTAGLTNAGNFPIGTTTVTYTATDAKNNKATCSFAVSVTNACLTDATAPVMTACPANKNLTTTGTTAVASWTAPTATDNCTTPSVTYTTSPTAGLTNAGNFPIGTTTVTYTATDAKNNKATCSFAVSVSQSQPPTTCIEGLSGSYYSNRYLLGTPSLIKVDNSLNFNWGTLAPNTSVPSDNFSIRWIGQTKAPITGYYTFYLDADDGVRLWVNNTMIINRWATNTNNVTSKATVYLTAGQRVPLQLEYYESTLTAKVALSWSYTGVPKQIIPSANLCSNTTAVFSLSKETLTMDAVADYTRSKIQWINNTGDKNDYFVLQKQNPLTGEFDDLKIINDDLKSTDLQYYTEYDESPLLGDNFYRVKLVLNDGSTAFTEVKKVSFPNLDPVSIYPNPAQDELNVNLKIYKGEATDIYIYNNMGQLVQKQHIDAVTSAVVTFDVSEMVSGQYLVRIASKGKKDYIKQVSIAR